MASQTKYIIKVVRGAFINPKILDDMGAKTIQKLERDEWISIDEIVMSLKGIKKLQREMTRHYDDTVIPWYMDGYKKDDKNELLVAFGADDGEGGRIFTFNKNDKDSIEKVFQYGISKGIPKEQMKFYEIDF